MNSVVGRWMLPARSPATYALVSGVLNLVGGALVGKVGLSAWLTAWGALAAAGWLWDRRPRAKRTLEANAEGISVNRQLVLRREAVRACSIEPGADGVHVRFETTRPLADRIAIVASVEDAERLVAPLDVPVRRRVLSLGYVALPTETLPAAVLMAALLSLGAVVWASIAGILAGSTLPVALGAVLALFLSGTALGMPRSAALMADGIRIGGRGVLGRFVPFTKIASLATDGRRLTIGVGDGARPLCLRFPKREDVAAPRAAIEARIAAAESANAATARAVARGDTYRRAAVRAEDLVAAIASPSLPREVRIASAHELAHREGVSATELRRIASETGDAEVERALLQIADSDAEDVHPIRRST